jgi:hypothetical protein
MQRAHKPLYDVDPQTGASIEVFYTDRLATFGRRGTGWFWWPRQRGFAPAGRAHGPFPTSYAAYRHAISTALAFGGSRTARRSLTHNVNADTVRTREIIEGKDLS